MRNLAGRHGLSATALHRHKEAHLPKALAKAQEAEEIVRGGSLLEEMEVLVEHGHEILAEARAAGEHRTALNAMSEIRGCLELLGKVTGEIHGPEHAADPRPMFALPDGSYPRITVEVERDNHAIDITPELPDGD